MAFEETAQALVGQGCRSVEPRGIVSHRLRGASRVAWVFSLLAMSLPLAPLGLTVVSVNYCAPAEEHEAPGQTSSLGAPVTSERRSPAARTLLRGQTQERDSRRIALLAHEPPAMTGHVLANGVRAPLCC